MTLYNFYRFGKLAFSKIDRRLCDAESLDPAEIIKYLFESTNYKCYFNTKYVRACKK